MVSRRGSCVLSPALLLTGWWPWVKLIASLNFTFLFVKWMEKTRWLRTVLAGLKSKPCTVLKETTLSNAVYNVIGVERPQGATWKALDASTPGKVLVTFQAAWVLPLGLKLHGARTLVGVPPLLCLPTAGSAQGLKWPWGQEPQGLTQ